MSQGGMNNGYHQPAGGQWMNVGGYQSIDGYNGCPGGQKFPDEQGTFFQPPMDLHNPMESYQGNGWWDLNNNVSPRRLNKSSGTDTLFDCNPKYNFATDEYNGEYLGPPAMAAPSRRNAYPSEQQQSSGYPNGTPRCRNADFRTNPSPHLGIDPTEFTAEELRELQDDPDADEDEGVLELGAL